MKTIILIIFIVILSSMLFAQQRVLLHRNADGEQEAMPMQQNETTKNAIERFQRKSAHAKAAYSSIFEGANQSSILRDSLFNYSINSTETIFSYMHQDVALQWFLPLAEGVVKEFWWRNGQQYGEPKQGTIRAWYFDERVTTLSFASPKWMGYYKDPNDSDGNVQPFKPESGDTLFYGNQDSTVRFSPVKTEAEWHKGGITIGLDSLFHWQGIRLSDFGNEIKFSFGQPFGFSITNEASPGGIDERMSLLATAHSNAMPFYSFKFYEQGRNNADDKGWWQRTDYEWEFYVVVEYTVCRAPKIIIPCLKTTLQAKSQNIKIVTYGCSEILGADLFYKFTDTQYSSLPFAKINDDTFQIKLPEIPSNDTLYFYVQISDVNGNVSASTVMRYTSFKPSKKVLFLWNGRLLPVSTTPQILAQYYMKRNPLDEEIYYDIWDVKSFETDDLPQLFDYYDAIFEFCGDGTGYFDNSETSSLAAAWLEKGTVEKPKFYLMSDQDRGGFFGNWDTLNSTPSLTKYFGILSLIDQDYPYSGAGSNLKPWQLNIDSSSWDNPMVKPIIDYQKLNDVTMWYDPHYEWPFNYNWMDAILMTEHTTPLFRDYQFGNKIVGVTKSDSLNRWHTVFLAFDWLSLDFRSDTSTLKYPLPTDDPKYKWIYDVTSIVQKFYPMGVRQKVSTIVPNSFLLGQNYPNPFNPATTIYFSIPSTALVTIKVFDLLGREITTLMNEKKPAGTYDIKWNASTMPSGIYFYRINANNFTRIKKMVLLK